MRWCRPTRMRPLMSAATMDHPTQVNLRPAPHSVSIQRQATPMVHPWGPGPTLLMTTHFPRQDPLQGPTHPETRNSSGPEPLPIPKLTSPPQARPFSSASINTRSWAGSDPWWLRQERAPPTASIVVWRFLEIPGIPRLSTLAHLDPTTSVAGPSPGSRGDGAHVLPALRP